MPYSEYFKAASEALIIADSAGIILEVNPKAEELFGYTQEELTGQTVEILLPAQLRTIHHQHSEDYLSAPRNRAMGAGLTLSGRRKDGSDFPIEVSLTYAPRTERGELIVAAVIDISERLALESEARRAETVAALGTVAAGIAHDLNNPLQTIRSRAELMLESFDSLTAAEMKEDLAAIHRQAQRAGLIVQEFLALSRRREKSQGRVNLNQLIERVSLLIGDQLRKAGIIFQTHPDPDLPELTSDGTALERVLINLVANARDAMPKGGAIKITSGRLGNQPNWVYLSIADTGEGIPTDALGKVFDLLYTTKAEGSGLGLWLSRRIVHEHGGKLEVQSELGLGTTFTIKLPLNDFQA
ncbi:MAG: ATP-binding protein [Candidatus Binataceae bacterium]